MKIRNICTILDGERKDVNNNIEGNIPVYGSGKNPLFLQMNIIEKVNL